MGQTKQALEAYSSYVKLNDSLYSVSNSEVISDIQTKYETDKKEQENKLLQQENSLKQNAIDARNKTILVLAISIILIVILITWRLNVNRLKKKFIELENQKKLQEDRERISRDLHDNVGGQLSYVMFSLEGKEENSADKRKEKSQHLATSLRAVTSNLRETIWALNKETLSLQDVSDKLKLYARNMFAYSDIKLRFEEHIEHDAPLHPAFALHVFRICQEILNNVFKHSQATELHILIERSNKICITISDNGVGFDLKQNTDESFGIGNLQTRADEIHALLNISSELQKGTTVSLIV
jgi:signal transduction histidine kinase